MTEPHPNSMADAREVRERYTEQTITEIQRVIRDTRARHPVDATCECEAMEVLGYLLRRQKEMPL
jgi:hypothetical protein